MSGSIAGLGQPAIVQQPDIDTAPLAETTAAGESGRTAGSEAASDVLVRAGDERPPPPAVSLSSNPGLQREDEGGFARVTGPVFRDGASWKDVDQGSIGDCYLMAACASIAAADPSILENMISDHGDGTYTVTFQTDDGPHQVRVNDEFPEDVKYADPSPNGQSELWVALIEKAYASWQGGGDGYEGIGGGGSASRAMEHITGNDFERVSVSSSSNETRLFNRIKEDLDANSPVAAGSPSGDDEIHGIHGNHAYTVLEAYERDGTQYVKVLNPWGTNDGARTAESMTTELTMEQFTEAFSSLYLADD